MNPHFALVINIDSAISEQNSHNFVEAIRRSDHQTVVVFLNITSEHDTFDDR
jgi:hypothetical protein